MLLPPVFLPHSKAMVNIPFPMKKSFWVSGSARMEDPRGSGLAVVRFPIPAVEGACDPLIGFGEMTLKIPSAWDFAY